MWLTFVVHVIFPLDSAGALVKHKVLGNASEYARSKYKRAGMNSSMSSMYSMPRSGSNSLKHGG